MPLFTDAYLADTRHLSTTEHGAYLLLLIVHWRIGESGLPDDERLLARYTGLPLDKWRRLAPTIRQFFEIREGRLVQARVLDELQHLQGLRARSSAGGSAKALKTKGRHAAKRVLKKCQSSAPTPTPTPLKEEPDGSSKKQGRRLPDNWEPSGSDIAFAKEAGHDAKAIALAAATFRDYWHAQPGQRGVKLDWAATWRNWIRREGKTNGAPVYRSKSGHEYRGSLNQIERECERRQDMDTLWRVRADRRRQAEGVGSLVSGIVAGMKH